MVDLSTVPLAPAPPGYTTDFSDEGYAPSIKILLIILLVLNTIFVLARVYTRAVALKAFGVDDGWVVFAWMTTSAHMAVTLVVVHYGFGRHIWNIPASNASELFKNFFVLEAFSCIVYMSLKLAFLFTYLRIFSPTPAYRWAIWGGIIACSLFYIGSFFWEIFKCDPIALSWDPSLKGTCASEFVPGGETGVFNVISDVYILILPIPMIWNLQTSVRRKVQLFAVFSVGLFTVITSIVRLALTIEQANNPDLTYALGKVDIWALLEYSVGLMVACTFVFTALWNKVLQEPLTRVWSTLMSATHSGSSSAHTRSDGNSNNNNSDNNNSYKSQTTFRRAERSPQDYSNNASSFEQGSSIELNKPGFDAHSDLSSERLDDRGSRQSR